MHSFRLAILRLSQKWALKFRISLQYAVICAEEMLHNSDGELYSFPAHSKIKNRFQKRLEFPGIVANMTIIKIYKLDLRFERTEGKLSICQLDKPLMSYV